MLLSVTLGMRESYEDWQALGRDLIARGLGAPMLIVADGAPGLIKAIEQCWPASDRQRCCVHRARNLYAKLPERERERVKRAYWQALDDAINERDAKQRLQALVDELDKGGFTAAAKCLADDLDALALPTQTPPAVAVNESARAITRRSETADQGDGPVPRRGQLPDPGLGRPRSPHHPRDQRHQVHRARPPTTQPRQIPRTRPRDPRGGDRRID